MKLEDARILVVDDETVLCGIFAKWLSKAGCRTIRTAANGEEAVEAIRQQPIDILITDVRMPVMDGVTLVRTLAAQGERIRTIIFVSGFGDVDHREMYDLGVEEFLAKPFRIEELAAAIDKATADRSELWNCPMEIAPRQTLRLGALGSAPCVANGSRPLHVAGLPHLGFSLGRGGFSARAEAPLAIGKVSFDCSFATSESEALDLHGQGFVRWRSKENQAIGVEFTYLESPGREWIIERIDRCDPRPFIPSLTSTSILG